MIKDVTLAGRLLIARDGAISVCYSPFDRIERSAQIVIAGITPGRQQAQNALLELRRKLLAGSPLDDALRAAKTFASFSGPLRNNLVAMLDFVQLNRRLGIGSTAEIWGTRTDLAHFTSALRYPVFVGENNYNGYPSMVTVPILRCLLSSCLSQEAEALSNALWIPLGPAATKGIEWLVKQGLLTEQRVLAGLPHPSGANAERIAYFVGRKPRAMLSKKTNPDALDNARAEIRNKIRSFP